MRKALIGVILAVAAAAQPVPVEFRSWMNQGVSAYKAAKYGEATAAFQKAADLMPNDVSAHLYLATANMTQWIPGADSPENNGFARQAEEEFKRVLSLDPKEKTALASLASLAFNQASSLPRDKKAQKFEEAASWNHKLIEVDSTDKEAYYNLGVIAWTKWHPVLMDARKGLRMKPEDPGPLPSPKVRADLLARFGGVVDGGIADLKRAIELDPEYDDALAYLNLLIRERADLLDTKAAYNAAIEVADETLGRALNAKKAKALRAESRTAPESVSTAPPSIPAPPPRPPEPTQANAPSPTASPKPISISAAQMERRLIRKADPVYPPKALEAHIQGVVRFTAVVAKDGTVENLKLVSGHPLLVQAALDAAKKYLYIPTLVENEPASVVTTLEIRFSLP
ncbi:MAG TPA: TonB family protein [Bryobacteraceae bacterium]|nr:TonB family protein [Bryobacteraceae bacterium]